MKKLFIPVLSTLLLIALILTFKHLLFPSSMTPAYFIGKFEKKTTVIKALKDSGFSIVSESKVGKEKMDLIIFSHPEIDKLANQSTRGFLAGSMRILLNKQANEIRITNPNYFIPAFLQTTYVEGSADKFTDLLKGAFKSLTASKDQWPEASLQNFQYMMSQPYYHEVAILDEDETLRLVEKIDAKVNPKDLIFKISLSNERFVYGVMPSKRTSKFVDKIGSQNALALPWMILIEEGKATMMKGQYYIALCYPLLTMGTFMTIATVPGAIEKDLSKLFK